MGYELPETVNPETITFCIKVPNEQFHLQAFWGAFWTLTRPYNWADDDDHTALAVAEVWRELWFENHEDFRERECCMSCEDTNVILKQILELMQGGFYVKPLLGVGNPPDEGGGNCAPYFFDHDEGDEGEALIQRKKALCITVERYVKAILLIALTEMSAASTLIDFVTSQFPQSAVSPFLKLTAVYPYLFSGLDAFFNALFNVEDLTQIACTMINALSGDKNNTFVNFRDALEEGQAIRDLVRASNGLKMNFTLFNEALEAANEEDLSEYECPCNIGTDCEEPLDLQIQGGRGISITHVSGTLYHFVGDPSVGSTGGMDVIDGLGRCMSWWNSDDPEHLTQTVPYHAVTGCCGTPDSEGLIGGFAGITEDTKFFTRCYWDQQTEPVDTYYNVKCYVCP